MDAVDTNVLLRYLISDDPVQFIAAKRCIESGGAKIINPIVVVETVWVLESVLKLDRADIAETLDVISASEHFVTAPRKVISAAIEQYALGFDFADALIVSLNQHNGAEKTYTFDRKASKMAGFERLGVVDKFKGI